MKAAILSAILMFVCFSTTFSQNYNIPGSNNVTIVKDSMTFITDPEGFGITVLHTYTYKVYNTPVNGGNVKVMYTPMYSYWLDDTVMVKSIVHTGAAQNISVDSTFESHVVLGEDEKTVVTGVQMDFVKIDEFGNIGVFSNKSYKQYDTPVNDIK